MSKFDNIVGLLGVAAGLIGVGYAIGANSKMAKISEKLDCSIEELADKTSVNIPDALIEKATEQAVAREVKNSVSKATDLAIADIKHDIHRQVSDAIESEYSNIKNTVLEEIIHEAAKIDVNRVRANVEKAAREHAIEKFDDNLDSILEDFNKQLNNTSKIYTSIADSMSKYKSNEGGTVLRIN